MTINEWLDTDDQMCIDIVERKYILEKELLGHTETIDELLDRVAGGNDEVKELIRTRKFLPGGRIIANRGLSKYGQKCTYSNCYVDVPPEDSIEGIYESCARIARTFSYGGGVGIDISNLAPRGARVNNTARYSTGAVSFVNTFSEVAETIGIKGRRGALMVSIDCTHPDLKEFITHKSDLEITTGANMSVRVTDKFFNAVKNDDAWTLYFTRKETGETIEEIVQARDIMHLLAKTNWDYAEPGMLYWDRISHWHLMQKIKDFKYAGTNPCGEEPLLAGGSCLLGAMNLSEYVYYDGDHHESRFDFLSFMEDVKVAVVYLNEVLDEGANLHPLGIQRDTVRDWRPIGLGVMGLADMFIKMHIRYGCDESIELTDMIGYSMIYAALDSSCELASKRGAFRNCDGMKIVDSDFYQYNIIHNPYLGANIKQDLTDNIMKYGLHNSQLLTCAPTGTISTILNISGGIEPVFALEFNRTTKSISEDGDKTYTVYPKAVKTILSKYNKDSLADFGDELPDYLITSRDIPWKERVNVQAALQWHIDAAISATINLPESTTPEDIEELYTYAHEAGLKGVTVYRENCKRTAILNDTYKKKSEPVSETDSDKTVKAESDDKTTVEQTAPSEIKAKMDDKSISLVNSDTTDIVTRSDLGEVLSGRTYYQRTACGHLYITINECAGSPVEVFVQSSKSGGCSANAEAIGRLTSTMLRSGVPVDVVIDSIRGVKCSACSTLKGRGDHIDGLSCADIVAKTLRVEANRLPTPKIQDTRSCHYNDKCRGMRCPECGEILINSEGCVKCLNCGYSKC